MVQLKKKVTIKTKTTQEETPAAAPKHEVKIKKKAPVVEGPKVTPEAPKTPSTPPTPPQENGGIKSWMWIVAIIVVAVIAFFGYKNCSGSETEASGSDKDTTSLVSDSAQTEKSDSTVAETPDTPEEGAPDTNKEGTDVPATDNGTPKTNNGGTEASKPEQKTAEPVMPTSTPENVDKPVAPTVPVSGSVEENARRVIRGDFGNGAVRKQELGDQYSQIQNKVNEMYRQRKGY